MIDCLYGIFDDLFLSHSACSIQDGSGGHRCRNSPGVSFLADKDRLPTPPPIHPASRRPHRETTRGPVPRPNSPRQQLVQHASRPRHHPASTAARVSVARVVAQVKRRRHANDKRRRSRDPRREHGEANRQRAARVPLITPRYPGSRGQAERRPRGDRVAHHRGGSSLGRRARRGGRPRGRSRARDGSLGLGEVAVGVAVRVRRG